MYEKWLKAFHMVATQGGFTRAARALNVGQPTISSHIKALEDHFRVELFHRQGRKFELSDTGRKLLAITQGLYGHEAEAASFLRTVGRNERGLLRLGAVGPYEVIELAHRFRERFPAVEIAVNVASRGEIVSRLANFEIDVGILADDIGGPEFFSMLYDRHPGLVMVPATHRFARQKSLRVAELQGEPVIVRDPSSATRRAFEGALAKAGVAVRPILEINSREAIREAVARGMGLGVVSEREYAPHPDIRALPLRDAAILISAYVTVLNARRPRPLIEAAIAVARDASRFRVKR
ncbi:MAG: LysR family transcriptional regulator [Acidimicrobiia bacterium]|nr:LysR family transcriptional regulator [Acidimicrobiia bacterium]